MEKEQALIDGLVAFWRYGTLPEGSGSAARMKSLAAAVLDRAGVHRLDFRVAPHNHRAQLGRLLQDLGKDAATRGLMDGVAHPPPDTLPGRVKTHDKAARLHAHWQGPGTAPQGTTPVEKTCRVRSVCMEIHFEELGGTWETRARTPWGRDAGPFQCALPLEDLAAFAADPRAAMRAKHALSQRDLGMSVRYIGQQLYRGLFQGGTRDLYRELLGRCPPGGDLVPCLQLCFGRQARPRMLLRRLPWEWMHDGRGYLTLQHGGSLARVVSTSVAAPRPHLSAPRVLMVADPDPAAFHATLVDRLSQAVGPPHVLHDATPDGLSEALHTGHFSHLHLHAPSRLNPESGRGEMALGETRRWTAIDEWVPLLRAAGVHTVFLQTPFGAVQGPNPVYLSMAEAMAAAGMPHVLALRGVPEPDAVVRLVHAFYRCVAQGKDTERALADARAHMSLFVPDAPARLPLTLTMGHAFA